MFDTSACSRRQLLVSAAGAAAIAASGEVDPARAAALPIELPTFRFDGLIASPVKIASIELLRNGRTHFVRTRSSDGAAGLAITNERAAYLYPILEQLVAPYFVGKDARQIDALVDGVYVHQSNYKLAGLALWNCVGWVEFSILDMLGKIAGKSVGELLGGVKRKQVAVYMSSMRRDTSPEQEVEWVGKRIAETGSRAVKLKIGGRMSRNADASPGRTEKLVALARKTFGEGVAIYVDANGSYDAAKAIEVGRMLEDHNVAFFEEPCPWEDYESTRKVAEALKIPVAGGEQDSSLLRFQEMVRDGVLDVIQPDVNYNGGLIRTIRVAAMAAAKNLPVTPHSPKSDPNEAYVLHFVSRTNNAGPHHEYAAAPSRPQEWYTPRMTVKNGMLDVPTGPGLGITIDPAYLEKAQVVMACGDVPAVFADASWPEVPPPP